jgi:hypothetical protein
MSPDTARAWATRLLGKELRISNLHAIRKTVIDTYGVKFHAIGESSPDEAQYILVTQSVRFNGYRGMDPSDIPQFEEGEREAIARLLLEREGASFHWHKL